MNVDLERLFRLRAAVGRFGEMDAAGWWNTHGVLGARGGAVYKRGLPQTHLFARVRVVSTVAAERSQSIYPVTGVVTLWRLPAALERSLSFQERSWGVNGATDWSELESTLSQTPPADLGEWLLEMGLVDQHVAKKTAALKLDPGGRGLLVPGGVSDETIQLLALGHARGGPKDLVVPFIRDALEADVG